MEETIFALFPLCIGIIHALRIIMSNDKDENEKLQALSIGLVSMYGIIFTAAGVLGSDSLRKIISAFMKTHKILFIISFVFIFFSFMLPPFSVILSAKSNSSVFERKKIIRWKKFLNRLSFLLFFSGTSVITIFCISYSG